MRKTDTHSSPASKGRGILLLTWMKRQALLLVVIASLCLAGCGVKEKVYNVEQEAAMDYYKRDELEEGVYYIKDGTNFMKALELKGNPPVANTVSKYFNNYLWMLSSDEVYLPTLYKNDSIVIKTSNEIVEQLPLIRYRDAGYTFGVSSLRKSQTGYSYVTTSILSGSDASVNFNISNGASIAKIDGQEVTASMLTSAGMVANLTNDEVYEVSLYSGSQSVNVQAKADVHAFIADSILTSSQYKLTQNDYLAYQMPDDAKTGYYSINGKYLFLYINVDRLDASEISDYDYNNGCLPISESIVIYNTGEAQSDPTQVVETEAESEVEISYDDGDESSGQAGTLEFKQDLVYSYATLNFTVGLKESVKEAQVISVWCEGPDGTSRSMIKINDSYTLQANMENTVPGTYTVNVMGNEIHRSEVEVQALLGPVMQQVETELETESETQPETFVVTGTDGQSYVVSGNQVVNSGYTTPQTEKEIFTEYDISSTMPAPQGGVD